MTNKSRKYINRNEFWENSPQRICAWYNISEKYDMLHWTCAWFTAFFLTISYLVMNINYCEWHISERENFIPQSFGTSNNARSRKILIFSVCLMEQKVFIFDLIIKIGDELAPSGCTVLWRVIFVLVHKIQVFNLIQIG